MKRNLNQKPQRALNLVGFNQYDDKIVAKLGKIEKDKGYQNVVKEFLKEKGISNLDLNTDSGNNNSEFKLENVSKNSILHKLLKLNIKSLRTIKNEIENEIAMDKQHGRLTQHQNQKDAPKKEKKTPRNNKGINYKTNKIEAANQVRNCDLAKLMDSRSVFN